VTARLPNRELTILLGAAGLAALLAIGWALAAYTFGVTAAIGLALALAAAALIAYAPTAGVCLAVLAAPADYLAAGGAGGSFSLTPSEAIVFLTAFSAAVRLATTITLARIPTALYLYGGLVFISIVGFFVALDTFTVTRLVVNWIAFGAIALYVSQLPLRSAMIVALSLAIAGGVLGLMSLGNLSELESVAGGAIVSGRAAASFAHPTSLALFLMMSFPLAFAFGLRGPRRLRLPMLALAALALFGLVLTQTRGSIIGAGLALVWMMFVWPPFRRLALAALAVMAALVFLNVGSISSNQSVGVVSERLSTLTLNSEGDQRIEIWETVPRIVADHPLLGVGQGNFPAVSPGYGVTDVGGAPFDHAHDLFLNVASELGLPALLLLLLLIGSLFAAAHRALRNRDGPIYPFAVATSASLLGLLVNSVTEYPLRQNLVMATIMIVIGLLLAFERASRDPAPGDRDAGMLRP
jgi:O-antigen ligase